MKATMHYDEHGGEWVVRLVGRDGSFAGLCGATGEAEARVIVDAINGVLTWQSARSRLGLNDAARTLRNYAGLAFGGGKAVKV